MSSNGSGATNVSGPRPLSVRVFGKALGSLTWPSVCALLIGWIMLMIVLITNDSALEAMGAPGVFALQGAGTAAEFQEVAGAWSERGAAALVRVGFSLGWDFVLILAYTIAFVAAGLRTREDLFPGNGAARKLALVLVLLFLLGAMLDGVENVLQLLLVLGEGSDAMASAVAGVTSVKWALVSPCMILALIGLIAAVFRRLSAAK